MEARRIRHSKLVPPWYPDNDRTVFCVRNLSASVFTKVRQQRVVPSMSGFVAVCLLFFGVVMIVGAVPVAVMMVCFTCDSGKPNRRLMAFAVFASGVVPFVVGILMCWKACRALF